MPAPEPALLADRDLRSFQELAYRVAGIRIADGKRMLVQHRLAKRLRERGIASYRDYAALLARDDEADERQRCIDALTTNETYFFRHKHHWDFIVAQVLPTWRDGTRVPRAWSAACSTGEEPYSLAILARELLPPGRLHIDASDINVAVLRAAAMATYGSYALQKVAAACLQRHFRRVDAERHRLAAETRELVRFRQGNLLEPTRGAPYDLVLLRNVLIYFDEPSKARALARVAERMAPRAWLLIGGAESLTGRVTGFDYVSPGIYRRSAHG